MDNRNLNNSANNPHNIIMENRKKVSISGVVDVDSFDEETVVIYTTKGLLTVKGYDFHINKLNVESGEVIIEGEVDGIEYTSSEAREKGGFFARMFK